MIVRCPSCGKNKSDKTLVCPFCGARTDSGEPATTETSSSASPVSAHTAIQGAARGRSATPAGSSPPSARTVSDAPTIRSAAAEPPRPAPTNLPPKASPGAVSRDLSEPPGDRGREEQILFALSLPILIPIIVYLWIRAKRWGRIPLYGLFIDACFWIGIARWQGFYKVAIFLALSAVACMVLAAQRAGEDQIEKGILLGYSDYVAKRVIFGGTLALIGVLGFFPWREMSFAWDVYTGGERTTRDAILGNNVESGTWVAIDGEKIDWSHEAYFTEKPEARLRPNKPN